MPFRTKNTYSVPGKGTYNTKKKTYAGSGPAPSGYRKTPEPTISTVPVVTHAAPRPSLPGHSMPAVNPLAHVLVDQLTSLLTPGHTVSQLAEAAQRLGVLPQKPPHIPKGLEAKTLGTPTVKQLVAAGEQGTAKLNHRGQITVPQTRQAVRGLTQARSRYNRTARPNFGGLSPAERTVAQLDVQAHKKYPDIPISVLMGDTQQESNFNPLADSGAAQGLTQFTPETARSYNVRYGNSPAAERSQVFGQARYLSDLKRSSGSVAGALGSYYGDPSSPYAGEVLQKAQAYRALDRPTHANPQATADLKNAVAHAHKLGLPIKPQRAFATIPGKGRFVFPFPKNKGWEWSRTDMGTDFAYTSTGAPIRALSSGTIVQTGAPGWPGGGGVLLKLDHAKGLPSEYVYIYEGIVPTVKAGQHVGKGALIGTGAITGSIETGFANSSGEALAHSIYTEGMVTPQGQAMTNFLHAIQKGKTRVPVRLLQVGGNMLPSGGGVAVSGGSAAVVAPAAAAQAQRRLAASMPLMALPAPTAASSTLPSLFRQFQLGEAAEPGEGPDQTIKQISRRKV